MGKGILGKGGATKSDEFLEQLKTAFDPPPSFLENYIAIFYDRYGCIYARRYDGQIVQGFRSAFFKVCLVLIFLNTIVGKKKHILNPEITILYQFHAQKARFKVPKICNLNFWIENDPPTLALFQKII